MKKVLFASGLKIPASTINKPVQNSKKEFALGILNASKGYFETLALSSTSKSTYSNYRSDLKKFVIWSIKQNRTNYPKLDIETIELYHKDVQNKFAKSTLSRQIKFLKSLSKWFEANGFSHLTNHTTEQIATNTASIEANNASLTVSSSETQTVGAAVSLLALSQELEKLKKWGFSYKPLTDLLGLPQKTLTKKSKLHFSQKVFLGLATMALVISGSTFMLTPNRTQISLETSQPSPLEGQVLAAVAPPRILSFQGRITNASGSPITSATDFVFKIYTVSSGGSAQWTSKTWNITPDSNGIFSVLLGDTGASDTTIPSTLFSENATLYLGVTVGADSEMTPRQRIVSSAYALNADALAGYFPSQTPDINQVPVLDASGNLIFSGAATIGTNSNGALTLAPNGTGDLIVTNGEGSNIQITNTPTSDATINAASLTLNPTGTGSSGTLQGFVISQSDNANTGVFDSLLKLENLKTPETTTNGLYIENNAASGTLSNGINIANTAGTLTDAIEISGTVSNFLNTASLDITGAGAITGATGVTSTGTFDINTSGSTAINIGTSSYTGTATIGNSSANIAITDANWGVTGPGVASFTGLSSSGTITFSSLSTVGSVITIASGGVLNQVNPSATTGDCLKSNGTGNQPTYGNCNSSSSSNSLDFVDFADTLDLDANLILNQAAFTWAQNFTPTTDATATGYTYTLTPSGTGATGTLNGMLITQADTGTTGAFDTLFKVENLKTPETVTNGIFIENNAASSNLSNALMITNTAGTLTDAIEISGTVSNFLNTASLDITGAGAITGATGVTSTGTFDINTSGSTAINIGTSSYTGTITIGNTSGAGALNLRAGSGNFTLDGVAGTTYTVGASTTTGTMTYGGTAQTGLLTLGQSSATNTVAIGSGTGATTVQIATGATNAKTVQIGTGAVANTITIGSASTTNLSITDDNWSISTAGLITTASDVAVNGGDITTTASTLNIDVANNGIFNFRDGTNNLLRILDTANSDGGEIFSATGSVYSDISGTGVAIINSATTGTSDTTAKYQSFTPDTPMSVTAVVAKIFSTNGTEEAVACIYDNNADAPGTLIAMSNQTLNISSTVSHVRFSFNTAVPLLGNNKYVLQIALQNTGVGAGCTTTTSSAWQWTVSASDIYSGGRSEASASTDYLFTMEATKNTNHGFFSNSTTVNSSTAVKTQSFTPAADIYLSTVHAKISMAGATEEASVCIYDENGSDGAGTLLAGPYQTLNIGSAVTWARFALTTPVLVQAGSKYVLQIAGQNDGVGASCTTTTTSAWGWVRDTSATYLGGRNNNSATEDSHFVMESSPIASVITLTNGSVIQSNDPTNGEINFGDGTLKVDFGTIDPPYFIDGTKYATYVASMTGQKEETTGVANLTRPEGSTGNFSYQINFPELETASDLGLFYRITDFGQDMKDLVVLLSTNDSRAKVWYERDPTNNRLTIFGNCNCEISYRLTAPRFDHEKWGNVARKQDGRGFVPGEAPNYSSNEETEFTEEEILSEITQIQDIIEATNIIANDSITIGQTTLSEENLKLLIGIDGSIEGEENTQVNLDNPQQAALGPITREEIDKMITDAIASSSAVLGASQSAQPESSQSAELEDEEPQDLTVINLTVDQQATFKDEVEFLNSVSLSNTNIAGSFSQDGIFTLDTTSDGLGSQLNVLAGTLYLQNLPTSGGLDLLRGSLVIDTEGLVKIAKLEAKNLTISTITVKEDEENPLNRIVGNTLLTSGYDLFDVETTAVTENSIILLTVEGELPVAVSVTEKIAGIGFRVKLAQVQTVDLTVSYLIVNQETSSNEI